MGTTIAGVSSRIVVGVAAWLLGAASATGGSLLAVEQLGHGILSQPSQPLTAAAVSAGLANERADHEAAPSGTGFRLSAPRRPVRADPRRPRHRHPAAHRRSAAAGTLLRSAAGSVVAQCEAGDAYLDSWIPQQGYETEYVVRGPAPVAKVTFRNYAGGDDSGGVVVRISCRGSTPRAASSPYETNDSRASRRDE